MVECHLWTKILLDNQELEQMTNCLLFLRIMLRMLKGGITNVSLFSIMSNGNLKVRYKEFRISKCFQNYSYPDYFFYIEIIL